MINHQNILTVTCLCSITSLLLTSTAAADSSLTFTDIVSQGGSGITYQRSVSKSNAIFDEFKNDQVFSLENITKIPTKPHGDPGVAVFDYDKDGDLDIYVTNGPDTANSLYSNQFIETGNTTFIDVADEANVLAIEQDSTGVCFGDIDNDGDHDLYVLGNGEENKLFENMGNGAFKNITSQSETGAGSNSSTTCSFGDVNGDGYLDVVVANLFDSTDHRIPLFSLDVADMIQPNQLFINKGNNTFEDQSASSGIQNLPGTSWSIALVDYDLDGDVDLFVADDQAARPPAKSGGVDAGVMRLFENDSTGKFTDITEKMAGGRFGAWMSLSFGDLNSDGHMDVYASNAGDYFAQFAKPMLSFVPERGEWESGWFLGSETGEFSFPGVGDLKVTPFGWGSAIVDYDNDGDLDIAYHGGFDNGLYIDASNPGAILENDGNANFKRDAIALKDSVDHTRRSVQGVAVGDLNNDGFTDIVSVSNGNWPDDAPLIPYFSGDALKDFGGPFDETAFLIPTFSPVDPLNPFAGFLWNGINQVNGSLAVELSNKETENSSVKIKLYGTQNITTNGRSNRDGIGAVIIFKPKHGKPVMKPVVSGATHASSHSIELTFGLEDDDKGSVEVVWPGGTRNLIYNVNAGETLLIPEIPCSFDDKSLTKSLYKECVTNALSELLSADVIDPKLFKKLYKSSVRSFGKPGLYPNTTKISFRDISEKIEFSHLSNGDEGHGGAAWIDYDNDNDLDLFMTNGIGSNNGLFRNEGDGTFSDVSHEAGIESGLGHSGALAGDIDNDGYTDLILTGAGGLFTLVTPGPVIVYRNNKDGTFSDITNTTGITGIKTSWGAALGDINSDGYLDLVITTPGSVLEQRQDKNKLFLNNGDMTFTDISALTGVDTQLGGCVASFSDYDLDGDQDIYIANCNEVNIGIVPIELFRNDGNLSFVNVTQQAGLTRLGAWMGLAIGDYDNDGDQDIFSTNLGNFPGLSVLPVLYENNGDGTFNDVSDIAGISDNLFGWGASFTDFNNDGYTDLFYAGSFPFAPFFMSGDLASPGTLFINNKNKTFRNKNEWLGVNLSEEFTSGVATADINNTGFSDIVIVSGSLSEDQSLDGPRVAGHPVLLENSGNDNNWITIKTVGVQSNNNGIGARIIIKSGDLVQVKEVRAGSSFLSTESPWPTFGIGQHKEIDEITVHWPSGNIDKLVEIDANKMIIVTEGEAYKEYRNNKNKYKHKYKNKDD